MGALDRLVRNSASAALSAAGRPVALKHSSGVSVPAGVVDWEKVRDYNRDFGGKIDAFAESPDDHAARAAMTEAMRNAPTVSYADMADAWYEPAGGVRRALELSEKYAGSDSAYESAADMSRELYLKSKESGLSDGQARRVVYDELHEMGPRHMAAGLPRVTPTSAMAQRRILPLALKEDGTSGAYLDKMPDAFQVDDFLAIQAADAQELMRLGRSPRELTSFIDDLVQADATAAHEGLHAAALGANALVRPKEVMDGMVPYDYPSLAKNMGVPLRWRLLGGLLPRYSHPSTGREHFDYLHNLVEMDARLPAVRRAFAYNTGRSVKNASDAEAAWRWYGRNFADSPAAKGLPRYQYDTYDSLHPFWKDYMMSRMALLPSLLLAPAAMDQDQEGLARPQ